MIKYARIVALAAIPFSFASSGYAFDGKEHTYVSNIAFRVAVFRAIGPAEVEKLAPERAQTLEEAISFIMVRAPLTYGDLVALVDNIKDIQPIFESPRIFGYPSTGSDVDWTHLQKLRTDFFRWAEAAHTNENHFQAGALTGHWLYHRQAISLANQGELLSALLVEAYADHFLEDFFAPGHVATPRSGFSDFASAASHDHYNRKGLLFRFNNSKDLHELITGVAAAMRAPEFRFPAPADSNLELSPCDFEDLDRAVDREELPFYGDSSLAVHKVQASFIASVVSRSIEDVLLTFVTSQQRDSFADSCFFFGPLSAADYVCGEEAAEYLSRNGAGSPPCLKCLRIARMHYGEFDLATVSPIEQFFYPLDLLLLSVFSESHTSSKSASGSRAGFDIESMLATYKPMQDSRAPFFIRNMPPAFFYGVSRTWDRGVPLDGVNLRYVFSLPRISTQISERIGQQQSLRDGKRHWQTVGELRAEMGFGMIFLYIGAVVVGDEKNVLRSIRSGITVMIPRSLWWKGSAP